VIRSRVGFNRRYTYCTCGNEKKQATEPYQSNEIHMIIPTVVKYAQVGARGGKVATKRLPKKAAVFGLEKLVSRPRRKAEKVLCDRWPTAKDVEDEERADQIVFRPIHNK
jgi:hypothetical protein